jgi:hypothetical protein
MKSASHKKTGQHGKIPKLTGSTVVGKILKRDQCQTYTKGIELRSHILFE